MFLPHVSFDSDSALLEKFQNHFNGSRREDLWGDFLMRDADVARKTKSSSGSGVKSIQSSQSQAHFCDAQKASLRFSPILFICAVLSLSVLYSSAASAVPVQYSVTGGSVTLAVSVGGVIVGSSVSPLTTGAFTTDDSAQSLNNFDITLDPNIVLNLSTSYGGYDTVTIESASLQSQAGFASSVIASAGSSYTVLSSPLAVNGLWGGSSTSGVPAAVTNQPITYPVPSMTAVVGGASMIFVNAVILNSLDGTLFGEAEDLVVIASINVDSAIVVPEPSTALLLLVGLGLLAVRKSR